jgi:hypothetical protein
MSKESLQQNLENGLDQITEVRVDFYKDTPLRCVYFKGKEIGHFHKNGRELDLRLSQKFAREHQLGPPFVSKFHPDRSKTSRWRVLPFDSAAEVQELIELIQALISFDYSD